MRSEVEINLLRDGYERQLARAEKAEHETDELLKSITRIMHETIRLCEESCECGGERPCEWCTGNTGDLMDCKGKFALDIERFDRLIVRGESDERTE